MHTNIGWQLGYIISATIDTVTNSKNDFLSKKSQYISIENPLHKQFEKACMCFETRRASTRDYTVCGM